MSRLSLVPALALRLKPYRQPESMQRAPNLATVKTRSGHGMGNQKGVLHRPSRTAVMRDLCLKKLGLQNTQKPAQQNPWGHSPPVAPQPPGQLSGAEVIT